MESALGVADRVRREFADFWSWSTSGRAPSAEALGDSFKVDVHDSSKRLAAASDDNSDSDSDSDSDTQASVVEGSAPAPVKKQQRRSAGYLPLLLPLAVVWSGGRDANLVGLPDAVSDAAPDHAPHAPHAHHAHHAHRHSDNHHGHSHAPSLDFEDEELIPAFAEEAAVPLHEFEDADREEDLSDGTLLANYMLFDVLGDTDPRVVEMFASALARLEAHRRQVASPSADKPVQQSPADNLGALAPTSRDHHLSGVVKQLGDCTGGVYLFGDHAIFKPGSQEAIQNAVQPGDPNPLRKGFYIGDGAIREVAAYQLDRAAGHFANVPATTLISVRSDVLGSAADGPRLEGSLQKFRRNQGSSGDFGSSAFDLEHIQAIALLDIRIFNTDRHGGNILVDAESSGPKKSLVPIDHGLCLPDFFHLGEFEVEWLYWRQARQPLSQAARDHVASLDAEKDASLLRGLGMREESILTLRLMTKFLKYTALTLNWSLHDIGVFLTRSHLSVTSGPVQSEFELLLQRAADNSADQLSGFLSGDGSVEFSAQRAQALLSAAETQWVSELKALEA